MSNFVQITSLTHCIVVFYMVHKVRGPQVVPTRVEQPLTETRLVTNQMFYQLTSLVQEFSGQWSINTISNTNPIIE